jgi:hypothetical protein
MEVALPDKWILQPSRTGFNTDLIVNGFSQMLLAAQVFFGRLYRYMAQEKLNSFDLVATLLRSTLYKHGAAPLAVKMDGGTQESVRTSPDCSRVARLSGA